MGSRGNIEPWGKCPDEIFMVRILVDASEIPCRLSGGQPAGLIGQPFYGWLTAVLVSPGRFSGLVQSRSRKIARPLKRPTDQYSAHLTSRQTAGLFGLRASLVNEACGILRQTPPRAIASSLKGILRSRKFIESRSGSYLVTCSTIFQLCVVASQEE